MRTLIIQHHESNYSTLTIKDDKPVFSVLLMVGINNSKNNTKSGFKNEF